MKAGRWTAVALAMGALLAWAGMAHAECKGDPGPGDGGGSLPPLDLQSGADTSLPGEFGVRDLFGCPFSIEPHQVPGAQVVCSLEDQTLVCIGAPQEEDPAGRLLYTWAYSEEGVPGDYEQTTSPHYQVKCNGQRRGIYLTVQNGNAASHASLEYLCN